MPLTPLSAEINSKFASLLESRSSIGRASGWVPLLHITLYFFQHDSKSTKDPIWTRKYILERLQSPEFDVKGFQLELSRVVACGTRTLRLKVEDPSSGLQYLHQKIVEVLKLPNLPGGWEGGHVSLYRFNNAETKALESGTTEGVASWVPTFIKAHENINYQFQVTEFKLYLSEPSGYSPIASFHLK